MTHRMIIDENGLDWEVFAVPPAILRQSVKSYQVSEGWLCFADGEGRRVRVQRDLFAGDWRRLNAVDLNRMLAAALRDSPPGTA